MSIRVAIIGAGMSGLGAARTLKEAGAVYTVFEAENQPGGRVRTDRIDGYVFDSGASSIAPRGRTLERVMLTEISQEGLVKVERTIYVHEGMRTTPGDPQRMVIVRYAYQQGNDVLPQRLAAGLDVRYSTKVESIGDDGKVFSIRGENFDRVILACPTLEALPLLHMLKVEKNLSGIAYRPCVSVLLGFEDNIGDRPYHALIDPDQRHPLTWLSIDSLKTPHRAPGEGIAFVAQLSPEYSRQMLDGDDNKIYEDTIYYLNRLFNKNWTTPKVSKIVRFRQSQPESIELFEAINSPEDRVLLAGDCLMGGRTELAYETGIMAAKMILES